MKRVYVSGPIMYAKGEDTFAPAATALRFLGAEPVNPKDIEGCPDKTCHILPHEQDKGMEHSWSCFMKYDLIGLLQCDAILMLPGWEDSHGARLELNVAMATRLQVLFLSDSGSIRDTQGRLAYFEE